MRKNNAGFTLVELIVSIAASLLVIGAALSFMLLGLRMEKAASDDVTVQSDSRIIMRVLENIAAEGLIGGIKYDDSEDSPVKWELYESVDATEPILSFNKDAKTINGKDNVVIIDGIENAGIVYENNLLSCTVETSSGDEYTSSVYCRIGVSNISLAEIEDLTDEEKYIKSLFENTLSDVEAGGIVLTDQDGNPGWELRVPGAEQPIMSFDKSYGEIAGSIGVPVKNVETSEASLDKNLLICSIIMKSGKEYTVIADLLGKKVSFTKISIPTSVEIKEEGVPEAEIPYRKALLAVMASQYGSTGKIDWPSSDYHELYYSQWYQLSWGRGTPWCAIFVAWCLDTAVTESPVGTDDYQKLSSLVDNVMWYQFDRTADSALALDQKNNSKTLDSNTQVLYDTLGEWKYPLYTVKEDEKEKLEKYIPNSGDLVFFENDDTNDRADHLGVVLYVENDMVYTIEGNNENRVGIFSYPLIDTERKSQYIIGYGVLDWQKLFPAGNWPSETK